MSQFIESIKVENGKVFLLDLHQKRVNDTFNAFSKPIKVDLKKLQNKLEHNSGLCKWRVVYDLEGKISMELLPYQYRDISSFKVVVSNEISYPLKSVDRVAFETLKSKVSADEILIVKNGLLTDTSFSNLVFKKGMDWFTPTTFLLDGVQRQSLLLQNRIKEIEIGLHNIQDFSHFKLINAMCDFVTSKEYLVRDIEY